MRTFSVGTDIGGTFTDMVVVEPDSVVRLFKFPTTPDDRSLAVVDGFRLAADEYGMSVTEFARSVRYFAHGTTAATNALVERNGAVTGLITTRGFADSLLLQRATSSWVEAGDASGHYSQRRNRPPIVDPRHIVEVDERRDYSGEQVVPLDVEQVRAAARQLRADGVEAVAICFMWSFVHAGHEREAAAAVRAEWPAAFLTLSSDIAPVIGEYERTATAVVNSYLGPVINRYLGLLEQRLREHGYTSDFTVMDSAGGVMAASQAAERAVELLASGPAGGVLASAALGRRLGYPNVITSDMGGTSFDVGLVVGGEPLVATTSVDGGYHLAAPRIQITAVGSGGGSIARVDEDGVLVVGPESAGAVPGPACYGRGGTRPSVTDADVTLGIIDPAYFLGGRLTLHRELAQQAIDVHIAQPLGLPVARAAAGVRNVVDNQMADLLRNVTIQQGHDPRDFVLFAYGGAGPTHAYSFAPEAGIGTIVVPYTATVNSAYGAVSSDRYRGVQLSDPQRTPPGAERPELHLDPDRINRTFDELAGRCRQELGDHPDLRLTMLLYFRFRKQIHELPVTVPDRKLATEDLAELVHDFRQKYERVYGEGTSMPEAGIEINTFRVEGRIPSAVSWARRDWGEEAASVADAQLGSREVLFEDAPHATDVYRGERVPRQAELAGPAILEFPGTTVVVGPRQHARVDQEGNIVITTGAAHASARDEDPERRWPA